MFVVEESDRPTFPMNAFNRKAMKISVFYFASRFIIYHVKFVKKCRMKLLKEFKAPLAVIHSPL